ncbi:sulfate adenylyltransferase subunit 1 [Robbsia andropogonis]|uniref:sulfate adenylyltransferase subunit 1 n=1 Tax=Robbsia andropogonis TaxID=28092 RepID=UPI0004BA37C5|nr:GTP-binding protein [Robbsia andropogonis]MCP1121094.1 GTP-binding protein [Robbsia andropogonis]MCP1130906.1 GTP-binding protein [Robbsia andropogonis]
MSTPSLNAGHPANAGLSHASDGPVADLGVLRFITAGSVDDGKSTLIGRLLYDSRAVLSDQLGALARAKNKRTVGDEIDLAQLTDGLEAEREQGITIDVAYRYFATGRRKFIIADTPGHEQYTRNMVTGASTAHAAIVLIDATRVTFDGDTTTLLAQTKRHSAIVKLLGIQHVIVAVNKMDLVDYSESVFDKIREAYVALARRLGLRNVRFVPVSALKGDNVVTPSEQMPWYGDGPLLSTLELLPVAQRLGALRFPVQWVARQDGSQADDFRGYMGRIESGGLSVGQKVRVLPGGIEAEIAELIAPVPGGTAAVRQAHAGQCVTVRLTADVDVSRGDMFVEASSTADAAQQQGSGIVARKLEADICWLGEEPLSPLRKYLLKHTTATVFARVSAVKHTLDVHTLDHTLSDNSGAAVTVKMNDIGAISLNLQKPIVCDTYDSNPATGAFVLIDEATYHTVAAGMIRQYSA